MANDGQENREYEEIRMDLNPEEGRPETYTLIRFFWAFGLVHCAADLYSIVIAGLRMPM